MPKIIRVIIFVAATFLSLAYLNPLFADAEPEKLTITTYFPIPSGTYKYLTTTGNTYLATSSGSKVRIGEDGALGVLTPGLFVASSGNVGIGQLAATTKRLYVRGSMYVKDPNVGGYTGNIAITTVAQDGTIGRCTFTVEGGVITAYSGTCPDAL